MNKIVISHGDKGGAGKSVVAAVTVDYFLELGVSTALVEGDLKTRMSGDGINPIPAWSSGPFLSIGPEPPKRPSASWPTGSRRRGRKSSSSICRPEGATRWTIWLPSFAKWRMPWSIR